MSNDEKRYCMECLYHSCRVIELDLSKQKESTFKSVKLYYCPYCEEFSTGAGRNDAIVSLKDTIYRANNSLDELGAKMHRDYHQYDAYLRHRETKVLYNCQLFCRTLEQAIRHFEHDKEYELEHVSGGHGPVDPGWSTPTMVNLREAWQDHPNHHTSWGYSIRRKKCDLKIK